MWRQRAPSTLLWGEKQGGFCGVAALLITLRDLTQSTSPDAKGLFNLCREMKEPYDGYRSPVLFLLKGRPEMHQKELRQSSDEIFSSKVNPILFDPSLNNLQEKLMTRVSYRCRKVSRRRYAIPLHGILMNG